MQIIRHPQVIAMTGLSRVTLWRLERSGDFPRRLRLGANSVGWLREEVEAWIESRAAARAGGEVPDRRSMSDADSSSVGVD